MVYELLCPLAVILCGYSTSIDTFIYLFYYWVMTFYTNWCLHIPIWVLRGIVGTIKKQKEQTTYF